ncbi:MAG: DUF2232 domain-containing protein [Alphaproteobacteria bacterium]|nr:DUF2232 domain-containing protein [Alphaproteobacteria bacterium]
MASVLSSRGALGWLSAALAGVMGGAMFVAASTYGDTLLVFLAYFSIIPLIVCGLGSGSLIGGIASLISTGVVMVFSGPQISLTYFLAFSLPAFLLMLLALRYRQGSDGTLYWYPEGYLLIATALYPCILLVIAGFMASGEEGGLLEMSTRALEGIMNTMKDDISNNMANIDADKAAQLMEGFKQMDLVLPKFAEFLPAFLGCVWIFFIIICGSASQSILKQQHWNLRDSFKLNDLQIPNWFITAVAASGLIGFFGPVPYDHIGNNLCVMLCVPYFFLGISVAHVYASTFKMPWLVLLVFYTLMSLMFWLVMLVALLGVIEQNINLRQRLTKRIPIT